ncbi:MAG: hypothetical protein R2792_12070 [Saprospiraceae bacterium]
MQASRATLSLIDQVNHVLEQLDPTAYRKPLPEYNGSTLGQHFRHILEFFQCLERGGKPGGIVDYASRERNLLYEDNPQLAKEAFTLFGNSISELSMDLPIKVRAEFDSSERPEYLSTVGLELVFVFDHAIHHLAIIKIGLQLHFPEVSADKDLGVSPSTLKFREAGKN